MRTQADKSALLGHIQARRDEINWANVHRTQEGNPQQHANPERQYWSEQLACISQKLHNLEFVSLPEPVYCELHETYTAEKQEIWQRLEELS